MVDFATYEQIRRHVPLWRMMSKQERLACFKFLRALQDEAERNVKSLKQIPDEDQPTFLSGMIKYWQHVAAGHKLAISRLGLSQKERAGHADQSV